MALTNRQESERLLATRSNRFWGRLNNLATAERVRGHFSQVDKTYYATTKGCSKSSPLNIFRPGTRTTSTSTTSWRPSKGCASGGEFAGLIVEGNRPEFRSTFRAEQGSTASPISGGERG